MLYERYLIQPNGFQNVVRDGSVIGFEVGIKIGYYRGISLQIICDLELIVDGESFKNDRLRFAVGEREFTMQELAHEEKARWEFGQTARLIGLKPRGLSPGGHHVEVIETIKPAYIPPDISARFFSSRGAKRLTLGPPRPAGQNISKIGLGVSLYSYQEEFYTGAMTLEDCLAEVAAIGATGVQFIPEQMMPGYPTPPPGFVERWHASFEKHGLYPTSMSTFVDMDCGGHKNLTIEEGVQKLVEQMKLAKTLGFKMIRPTTGPADESAPELVKAALPHAEKLDVIIAPEIHAPIRVPGPYIDSYVDLIQKTGTKHLGFTLDLGVYCKRLPPLLTARMLRKGAQARVVEYASKAFIDGVPLATVRDKIEAMAQSDADRFVGMIYVAYGPSTNDWNKLKPVIPHISNVHGKFYEITPEGEETSIPYPQVMAALAEGGYSGFIDSEFEGQRLTHDSYAIDSCEEVRRHHVLMARSLGRI